MIVKKTDNEKNMCNTTSCTVCTFYVFCVSALFQNTSVFFFKEYRSYVLKIPFITYGIN